jgi:hypothetical protein
MARKFKSAKREFDIQGKSPGLKIRGFVGMGETAVE